MLKSCERLVKQGWQKHLFRDVDLYGWFADTEAGRYALMNKALKAKEIVQVRRGLYALAPQHEGYYWSQYYLANHIAPCSFVTAESALSFHGWIPEQVKQVTSALAFGRNKVFDTPVGSFVYRRFPLSAPNYHLFGVHCLKVGEHFVWIASPIRALMDYIYWHKINHVGYDFLINSLRIDEWHLKKIEKTEVQCLMPVYGTSRVKKFLNHLLKEGMFHG